MIQLRCIISDIHNNFLMSEQYNPLLFFNQILTCFK